MPAPTTQFFTGWMPFLPPKQQRQSTEGNEKKSKEKVKKKRISGEAYDINKQTIYI